MNGIQNIAYYLLIRMFRKYDDERFYFYPFMPVLFHLCQFFLKDTFTKRSHLSLDFQVTFYHPKKTGKCNINFISLHRIIPCNRKPVMRMPAAGAKGSFTSIENSILINLFTANIIESSWGPPRLTPPHSHCSLPRACLAHCCAGICLETKGETRLILSPAMWVCRAVSLFLSPSYY